MHEGGFDNIFWEVSTNCQASLLLFLISMQYFTAIKMPNIYKRKFPEKIIDEDKMKKAIEEIKQKKETPTSAARKYGLKRTTLLSRFSKEQTNVGAVKDFQSKFSSNQVLTATQEKELTLYFKKCSNLHHGLTYDLARRFV